MPERECPITDLDRAIIRRLQEDGRLPVSAIARELGIPISTVNRRLNHLLKDGLLKIVAIPDSEELGLPIHVIIGIQCDVAKGEQTGEALSQIEEVRWVAMTAGKFDFLIEAFFVSNDHFGQFLTRKVGQISGIQRTETISVLRLIKHRYAWSELLDAGKNEQAQFIEIED